MKKISLYFVALVVVLGLAVSGCYVERRGYDRPHYHHHDHHDDDRHY